MITVFYLVKVEATTAQKCIQETIYVLQANK